MKYKIGQIVQLNESNYWWSNVKGEIVSIDSNCRKPYYKIKLIEGANKGEHYELPWLSTVIPGF